MGTVNMGNQKIIVKYFDPAASSIVNSRDVDILPRGIYKGGYLTKVDDVTVTLSETVVEVGDSTNQLRIETQSTYNVTVSVATPYVVLRWAYVAQTNNYMDILAVSSGNVQENDVVVGKCSFSGSTLSGFNYNDLTHPRTVPNTQDQFLKVVPTSPASMYLWVNPGHISFGTQNYDIPLQKIGPVIPPTLNSRYDLIYIDTDGSIKFFTGTAAASPVVPGYSGKTVLYEVLVVNGDTQLTKARLKDVRGSLASSAVYTGGNGITISGNQVSTKIASNQGLTVDGDGIKTVLKTDGALEKDISGIGVKLKTDEGLYKDSNGLGIQLLSNGGLSKVVGGLTTLLKTLGGLAADVNGLYIKTATTNPCLEFSDGGIRVKADGTTIQRTASGLSAIGGIPSANSVGTGQLKTATGSASGSLSSMGTVEINMNAYSFSPNLYAGGTSGQPNQILFEMSNSNIGDYLGRFRLYHVVGGSSVPYVVRWRYVNASDTNHWIYLLEEDGKIVRVQEAEDHCPVENLHPFGQLSNKQKVYVVKDSDNILSELRTKSREAKTTISDVIYNNYEIKRTELFEPRIIVEEDLYNTKGGETILTNSDGSKLKRIILDKLPKGIDFVSLKQK